jgi:hypothetical protein
MRALSRRHWLQESAIAFCACLLVTPALAVTAAAGNAASSGAGAIHAASDFETAKVDRHWGGRYDTPIRVMTDGGALGSKGYLRIGPHTGKWVGARCGARFVLREDTWLGFAARKPGGARIHVQIWDSKQKKNVSRKFGLPGDGSWRVFRFPIKWMGIAPGTPLTGAGFWHHRNDARAPISFDVDNVVIGTGKGFRPPQPVQRPTAVLRAEGVHLTWTPPRSTAGIAAFRVYRGLHAAFARDRRHLLLETAYPFVDDDAFAHNGDYFYAVRAVNFAGNEGEDAGAARVRVK